MEANTPNIRILECAAYKANPSGWVVKVEVPGEVVQVLPQYVGAPYPNKDSAIKAAEGRAKELTQRFSEVWIWNKEASGKFTVFV